MPTASGLPRKGDRVSLGIPMPENNWKPERNYGTVVERGRGDYWALYVRWDEQRQGQRGSTRGRDVELLVDATYFFSQGWLRIEEA